MAVPDTVLSLVERFDYHSDTYRSGRYNETQVRREFIDPLFKALGWDIDNESGYAEAYKDVIHEDAIKIGGATRAPDYSFRVGGMRKFFLEAKKPAVNIASDIHPAYQLRRYAWSAKLPLSILTDFEELAVYDCRPKPNKSDKSSTARVMLFSYTEYEQRWHELESIFSRDQVLRGSFDKFAESTKAKRGTAEVDDAFLDDIEGWREQLAKSIARDNPQLGQREINLTVQRTIDRIIFLRISEDRGIEPYGRLRDLAAQKDVYPSLLRLFYEADDRYNSGLFHFKEERGREGHPDSLSRSLAVDDKTLRGIIKPLYYPHSPYEFSVLPADILGQVYEQFLGRIIRIDSRHRAIVEEKPEVKKAGGVYYTPTYIVDRIVQSTIGPLLEGRSPQQVAGRVKKGSPLRIVDPACGSGSFLIGAYQHLLDWYRDWYLANDVSRWARAKKPRLYQNAAGEWRLTLSERKRILLDHIYGVDIDAQAVEVTKLSLLLKVLEGENEQSIAQRLFERILPDLSSNIKCGNSLIDTGFYENHQISLFNEDELRRINTFDWHAEFVDAFQNGGFDAVIGNPPYIRIQALKEFIPVEAHYYTETYETAQSGNYDIYGIFVEKGLQLLNSRGALGYIVPNKFLTTDYGAAIRHYIADRQALSSLIDFGHHQVFKRATIYTCLLF